MCILWCQKKCQPRRLYSCLRNVYKGWKSISLFSDRLSCEGKSVEYSMCNIQVLYLQFEFSTKINLFTVLCDLFINLQITKIRIEFISFVDLAFTLTFHSNLKLCSESAERIRLMIQQCRPCSYVPYCSETEWTHSIG